MRGTTLIARDDLARLVKRAGPTLLMDTVIERLRQHLAEPRADTLPVRGGFRHAQGGRSGVLEWMPYTDGEGAVTIKTVSYNPANAVAGTLPTIMGTISAYDLGTGRLLAMTDGVFLTALRTGAASAVASALLARPDSATVGLVGAGAQAVTQLHALTRVLPVERALVHDADPAAAASFADRVRFLPCRVEVADLADVEREADVLVTATSVGVGAGPVVRGESLTPHVHVNAIGSDLPGKVELPLALLREAFVCPDFREQAVAEGECQQLGAGDIGPELHELVRDPNSCLLLRDARTVFDSTGTAAEDHVAVHVLLELAREYGVGRQVPLEHVPADVRNPYDGLLASSMPMDTPLTAL